MTRLNEKEMRLLVGIALDSRGLSFEHSYLADKMVKIVNEIYPVKLDAQDLEIENFWNNLGTVEDK